MWCIAWRPRRPERCRLAAFFHVAGAGLAPLTDRNRGRDAPSPRPCRRCSWPGTRNCWAAAGERRRFRATAPASASSGCKRGLIARHDGVRPGSCRPRVPFTRGERWSRPRSSLQRRRCGTRGLRASSEGSGRSTFPTANGRRRRRGCRCRASSMVHDQRGSQVSVSLILDHHGVLDGDGGHARPALRGIECLAVGQRRLDDVSTGPGLRGRERSYPSRRSTGPPGSPAAPGRAAARTFPGGASGTHAERRSTRSGTGITLAPLGVRVREDPKWITAGDCSAPPRCVAFTTRTGAGHRAAAAEREVTLRRPGLADTRRSGPDRGHGSQEGNAAAVIAIDKDSYGSCLLLDLPANRKYHAVPVRAVPPATRGSSGVTGNSGKAGARAEPLQAGTLRGSRLPVASRGAPASEARASRQARRRG